ncbi:hypothetical protein IJG72_07165 [bacterium]|nr:hypothetical protein [bacterium]
MKNISIYAEKHISLKQYLLLFIIALLCFLGSLFIQINPYLNYVLIITFFPFLYLGYKELINIDEYVSEIELSDKYLTIKYTKGFKKNYRLVKIKLEDIQEFKLYIKFYPDSSRYNNDLKQVIKIKYADKHLEFSVKPTIGIDSRKWSFSLRLLSISDYIPKFSYTINTNERGYFIKKDIDYFYKNKKMYSFIRLIIDDIGVKNIIIPVVITIVIFFVFIIFGIFS